MAIMEIPEDEQNNEAPVIKSVAINALRNKDVTISTIRELESIRARSRSNISEVIR